MYLFSFCYQCFPQSSAGKLHMTHKPLLQSRNPGSPHLLPSSLQWSSDPVRIRSASWESNGKFKCLSLLLLLYLVPRLDRIKGIIWDKILSLKTKKPHVFHSVSSILSISLSFPVFAYWIAASSNVKNSHIREDQQVHSKIPRLTRLDEHTELFSIL